MREIEFAYLEVLNATEQMIIFTTVFNRKTYGQVLVLNTALTPESQKVEIQKAISALEDLTRETAKKIIQHSLD